MLDEKILIELKKYVENNLIACAPAPMSANFPRHENECMCQKMRSDSYFFEEIEETNDIDATEEVHEIELKYFINSNRKPAFNQILFDFIDKKGLKDSSVYKKAGIDRRHFSKIRSNPDYKLSKNSVIALALALELDQEETDNFLSAAGYSLSDSNTFDLVIQFCITKKIYDINNVNLALDSFRLEPLAGVAK